MSEQEEEDDDDESSGGGLQPEIIASYLNFARRALRARWYVSLIVFCVGLALSVAAGKYLPRTYSCSTALMSVGNPILDGRDVGNPFAGAGDLIMRHENLEKLIRELDLIDKQESRRPPLLRLKDSMIHVVAGDFSEEVKTAILVGTLENRIDVSTDKGDLTVKVEWTDGPTAAEIADAARESFLKTRRTAEIAAFEDKMAILDGHTKNLNEEITKLVAQLEDARQAKMKQARDERTALNPAAAAAAPPLRFAPPRASKASGEPDPGLAVRRERLEASRRKLAELEADRERKLREAQNKFEELKLRLTASHPEVITQGERVAMLQQIPSEIALLRAEVKDLEAEIRQGVELAKSAAAGGTNAPALGGVAAPARAAATEALPAEVADLLGRNDLDPALTAQLSSEVMKYGALRDEILSARIELDTAQAAFSHRYQVIIPAEVPSKPSKPKLAVVLGGGAFASLLLALLVPILAQLRRGIMIELWQVQQVNLPVLAELKLPPNSGND